MVTAAATATLVTLSPLAAQPSAVERVADSIMSRWNQLTPGCAVGVAQNGRTLLTKGYGMANLEYGVPLTAASVLESGSVAKQFTAAALALLQLEGKLSLDDDIRKYLPEAPDFGTPITIRHLLTHTSGLRDQWGLLSLTGNPPTRQVHSVPLILHLVSRQRDLNFPPGSEYLYSNTGYTLAGVIVQRVTGSSLAKFSEERFFKPMGMTSTQWRDDFERIVPGRATAYQKNQQGYTQLMPFTNVYGNGGLLTTVGDLLIWNEALTKGTITGGKPLVDLLETRGRLTSGVTISYALGLGHGNRLGYREISHSGSTAGYQTILSRFPDADLSIAVLCNVTDANPGAVLAGLASHFLPKSAAPSASPAPVDSKLLEGLAGRYRDPATDNLAEFSASPEGLRLRTAVAGGIATLVGSGHFRAENGAGFEFDGRGGVKVTDSDGSTSRYERVVPPSPSGSDLERYIGVFRSPELDVEYRVMADSGRLVLTLPPFIKEPLQPLYPDGFITGGRTVRFVRDSTGRVTGLRVFAGRVRNVRFDRVDGGT
jgi:CubicO group peptidase (beta-lactamase class C family)